MKIVPDSLTTAWESEAKLGDNRRPIVRATIQKSKNLRFQYDKGLAPGEDFGHQFGGKGNFTTMLFGQHKKVIEIPNLSTSTWSRSDQQDVAECTLTLVNTRQAALGEDPPDDAEEFDHPGWLSFNRGSVGNPWGYEANGWQDVLVSDRLVKTYEGYGMNPLLPPSDDPNLVQSGTWLIDDVEATHDGTITLKMRDIGRMLIDQIVLPPVLPFTEYPMSWSKIRSAPVEGVVPTGGSWVRPKPKTAESSNSHYVDEGLTNHPHREYVNAWGSVDGHRDGDPLAPASNPWDDHAQPEYWTSTGQPHARSVVWWQCDVPSSTAVNAVRLTPKGGPYRIYISVKGPDGWYGRKKIPYDHTAGAGEVNIHADIPFVDSLIVQAGQQINHVLKRRYGGVRAIRLTFTRLRDTGVGEYPFRAELKNFGYYHGSYGDLGSEKGTVAGTVGNYSDFTDIIKWVCAWGGFFWPPHPTGQDFWRRTDGTKEFFTQADADPKLPRGRVWGDFMNTGTVGIADLTIDLFDKQPLMNVIGYVRDQLGFMFFVDETGGAVWRLPNIWGKGNYVSPSQHANRNTRGRTSNAVHLNDEDHILGYSSTTSSRDIRDRIFVADTTGKTGVVIKGFKPYATGLRRTAGWTDEHFNTKRECVVMADMIGAQQMFSYRHGRVTINGYPAIQVDDQIKLSERMTSETYWHYVSGITSTLDMKNGTWTYDLDTHWMGEQISDAWVVDPTQLDPATQNYLELVDKGYGLPG